jgi:hypothetical protein
VPYRRAAQELARKSNSVAGAELPATDADRACRLCFAALLPHF